MTLETNRSNEKEGLDMFPVKDLKASIDFRTLVQETHSLTKGSKIACLWHQDTHPSLHIYQDGYYCFVCGVSGDAVDWLQHLYKLSFQEACQRLEVFSGHCPTPALVKPSFPATTKEPDFQPLPENIVETHLNRARQLQAVPKVLKGHGFSFSDCKRLSFAAENDDAIIPIYNPAGEMVALKCRYLTPQPYRYSYLTVGCGNPAWCSNNLENSKLILIVEGELNAMMCWLVLKSQQVGVVGVAGVNASFPTQVVNKKPVYLYADGDKAGQAALSRWANAAYSAGATKVYAFEPWPMDACDLVVRLGKRSLRDKLLWGKKHFYSHLIDAIDSTDAQGAASKGLPSLKAKPHLMQSCTPIKTPKLISTEKPENKTLLSTFRHDAS
ncbi:MAG: toprim domain-containing protein [Trueperaceae bacterium]|nr:toprim domain-containing protein [Trueperaceae bacterium]